MFNHLFRAPYLDADTGTNLSGGDTSTELGAEEQQGEQAPETTPETSAETAAIQKIKVKYNHQEMELPYEEAVTHIQKGMNYEKAVEKARQEALDSFIAEQYGESHGIKTLADYQKAITDQRRQEEINRLVQQNIPEEYAREMIENRKFRDEYQTEKQKAQEAERRQKQYTEFLTAYPDIKPEQIPAEVFQMTAQGVSLLDAYIRYENQNLKGELSKYQQQQQTQQANEANAQTSTGSVKSSGKVGGFISREQFDANKGNSKWVMNNLDQIEQSRKHWK